MTRKRPLKIRMADRLESVGPSRQDTAIELRHETWAERDMEGWRIAFRMVPVDGRPEVAELRVYPAESGAPGGRWSGYPSSVPPGGVPARVIGSVGVTEPRESLPQVIHSFREREIEIDPVVRRQGFTKSVIDPPKRPGRGGRSKEFYAEVARYYVAALERGQSPVVAVHERLQKDRGEELEIRSVGTMISKARDLGFITPAPRKGKAGGRLTDEAIRILKKEKERDQQEVLED